MGHFSHPGKDLGNIRLAAAARPKKSHRGQAIFQKNLPPGSWSKILKARENSGLISPIRHLDKKR
jgi:hypothetical protein